MNLDSEPLRVVPRPDDDFDFDFDTDTEPSRARVSAEPSYRFQRGDHVELGQMMLAILRSKAPTVATEGRFHQYGEGTWAQLEQEALSRIVQGFAGSTVGDEKTLKLGANDVRGALALARDAAWDGSFFDGGQTGLVFANGFVRVTSGGVELVPHSPDHRARWGYGFDYKPAEPGRLLRFLAEVWEGCEDVPERIGFVQEFFGACLMGLATKYQICLAATGDGQNGKGRFGEMMRAAMPPGSVCAIPPQEFEQEYRRAMLAGKRLNFVSELPEATILASESFKAIVSGDATTARHIREAPFTMHPVAGHYFAANKMPATNDTTHAFWRRWVLITFPKIFADGGDPDVHHKILAAELPAIVAWLVDGAVRVLARGRYAVPPSSAAALAEWRQDADQVQAFRDAATLPASSAAPEADDWNTAQILYLHYREWAEMAGHRNPMAINKFSQRLAQLGVPNKRTKKGSVFALRMVPHVR